MRDVGEEVWWQPLDIFFRATYNEIDDSLVNSIYESIWEPLWFDYELGICCGISDSIIESLR